MNTIDSLLQDLGPIPKGQIDMMTPLKWIECTTRRDRLDAVAHRCITLTQPQAARAWAELCEFLIKASEPGGGRTPKFNDLLLCIYRAGIRGRVQTKLDEVAKEPVPTSAAYEATKCAACHGPIDHYQGSFVTDLGAVLCYQCGIKAGNQAICKTLPLPPGDEDKVKFCSRCSRLIDPEFPCVKIAPDLFLCQTCAATAPGPQLPP